jgi:uncharacterized protein YrrD
MHRASEIMRKPVIAAVSGEYLGRVTNLILDERRGTCLGAVIERNAPQSRRRVLPFADITSIRNDQVVARDRDSPVLARDLPGLEETRPEALKGKALFTDAGERLGRIVDVCIDERGRIEGYELARGLASLLGRRWFISAAEGLHTRQHEARVEAQRVTATEPSSDDCVGLRPTAARAQVDAVGK